MSGLPHSTDWNQRLPETKSEQDFQDKKDKFKDKVGTIANTATKIVSSTASSFKATFRGVASKISATASKAKFSAPNINLKPNLPIANLLKSISDHYSKLKTKISDKKTVEKPESNPLSENQEFVNSLEGNLDYINHTGNRILKNLSQFDSPEQRILLLNSLKERLSCGTFEGTKGKLDLMKTTKNNDKQKLDELKSRFEDSKDLYQKLEILLTIVENNSKNNINLQTAFSDALANHNPNFETIDDALK